LVVQSNLYALDAALPNLSFGKIQMAQDVEHTPVLALHERVKAPHPFVSCCFNQSLGQSSSYAQPLPAILHEGRVLGSLVARFAIVAHDGDDLVPMVGI
jgi:hypothetical protein